ncbi:MAG TPA: glycosyltransferase family 2 protein [Solirubrobacteraceae bacterium]|nr:glycosyltransferase family 2 protein [Solirubrobacteraceae bacterium]
MLGAAQAVAAATVLRRLARGRTRAAPLAAARPRRTVSVVVPARDEAARIGPCLDGLRADPDVLEVIVVDDHSTDATAAVAEAAGARVVTGAPAPPGWIGKPWALQQGVDAATGEVVVCLDADTRPRPGLAGALERALGDGADLVCAGPRFVCDTPGERLLHPSFLTSIVYRFGPAGVAGPAAAPARVVFNGQCTATERESFLAAGGYARATGYITDDVALARALAADGWRIAFLDASDLLEIDMHDSAAGVWRHWGRSIAAADATPRLWTVADVATIWLTMALPVLRLLARRPRPLDLALLGVRCALLGPLRHSYARRGAPFWLSPLADPATALRITWSALRPPRRWRGREYASARPGGG